MPISPAAPAICKLARWRPTSPRHSLRGHFLARYDELRTRYEAREVPRPAHWAGYLLTPEVIEFWIDRPHRLHERRCFTRDDRAPDGWASSLLYP